MAAIFSLGEWVRRRRKALDLTQDALARQVGCALSMIRKIEADERRPSPQVAALLAERLLFAGEDREQFVQAARGLLAVDRLPPPVPGAVSATVPPRVAPVSLCIQLLGDVRIERDGHFVGEVLTPRLQSLLAFLVLHRNAPQSRQHLAFILWPESPEDRARNSLRKLLFDLRAVLPDADHLLIADRLTVQWRPDPAFIRYTADVEVFQAAAAHTDSIAQLTMAVEGYRGELVPGIYDEWVFAERERLNQSYRATLQRLITLLEQRHSYSEAIPYAERLLAHDPFEETAYATLMRLHQLAGNHAAALRVFHQCATLLQRELDTEPGPELQELYAGMLHPAALAPRPSQPPPRAAGPALVSREREWDELLSLWRLAASGQLQVVALTGEAGIGKSRLADEARMWLERQGVQVACASCYQSTSSTSYGPIAMWLRSQATRARLQRLAPLWQSEVARLLPELLAEQPALDPPTPLQERWQLYRFHEALGRALLHGSVPQALLLDDAQWSDADTLTFLTGLVSSNLNAPALLVLTLRVDEVLDDSPIAVLRRELVRIGRWQEIALARLSEDATQALARQVLGVTTADITWVYRETEGNPLFVVEMLRAQQTRESGPVAERVVGAASLPGTVQSAIESRIAQLSPVARSVADAAAVVGRAFRIELLASVVDMAYGAEARAPDEFVMHGLDELWRRQIIREQDGDAYGFTHDKLRVVVYAAISPVRRRVLHRRTAEALEASAPEQISLLSGQIAEHYERAGQVSRALVWYQRAAEAAGAIYAHQEAIALLERALALDPDDPATAAAIHESLADHLHTLTQYDVAAATYERALALVDGSDRLAQARLIRKAGESVSAQHNVSESQRLGELALAVLGTPREGAGESVDAWWREWLDIQLSRVWPLYWLGQVDQLMALVEEMRPVVDQYATLRQRFEFLHRAVNVLNRQERFRPSERQMVMRRKALAVAEQTRDIALRASALFGLGFACLWHGDLEQAESHLHATHEHARRLGDFRLVAQSLTYLGVLSRLRGQVEAAEPVAREARALAERARIPLYIGTADAHLACVALRRGDLELAAQHAEAARHEMQQDINYPVQWLVLMPLLALAAARDDLPQAVTCVGRLLDPAQQPLPLALTEALQRVQAHGLQEPVRLREALRHALAVATAEGYL